MAPGYVIALTCEAAGLIGLVVGLLRMRTERRERAAGLRGLLLTGNATAAGAGGHRSGAPAPRRVIVVPTPANTQHDATAARAALHRALGLYTQPDRSAA